MPGLLGNPRSNGVLKAYARRSSRAQKAAPPLAPERGSGAASSEREEAHDPLCPPAWSLIHLRR